MVLNLQPPEHACMSGGHLWLKLLEVNILVGPGQGLKPIERPWKEASYQKRPILKKATWLWG